MPAQHFSLCRTALSSAEVRGCCEYARHTYTSMLSLPTRYRHDDSFTTLSYAVEADREMVDFLIDGGKNRKYVMFGMYMHVRLGISID